MVTPTQSIFQGMRFGKGIYFADMFDKSSGFSNGGEDEKSARFLLLCEVALGREKVVSFNEHQQLSWGQTYEGWEKNYDSLHVIGQNRPEEEGVVKCEEGWSIPLGHITKGDETNRLNRGLNQGLNHSEYVVIDEARVKVRFLVRIGGEDKEVKEKVNNDIFTKQYALIH